ncbi:C-type lectin domain family 17, member A-like [Ruditapes philippinarum]|uniref:C-type lectin domain family 17, member A-like n=1 Tax=Ruditapes philippinarum TaxID=129788 RepID=UPI00295AB56E|nr:C-type lectin domain family 17, member A-like [Ruditapes philippinarum]
MIFVLIFVGLLCGITGYTSTGCYDGWLAFDGSCYYFGTNAVHFTEAEHFCRQHNGGHLIHVDSKQENDFIKSRLRMFKPYSWWMGLTDELIEGTWKWFDNGQTANFTDWHPGEPNGGSAEECAVFYIGFDFAWVDTPCLLNNYPICELPGVSTETEIVG